MHQARHLSSRVHRAKCCIAIVMYPRERVLDQLVVVEAGDHEAILLVEECISAYVHPVAGRAACAFTLSEELSITHRLPDGGGSCTSNRLHAGEQCLTNVSLEQFDESQ